MTEKTVYICDYCKTHYTKQNDAKKCEKSHVYAKEVKNSSNYEGGKKYPQSLEIEMSDGEVIEYKPAFNTK